MKQSELRIGNYVLVNENIYCVLYINPEEQGVFSPIPLTEEWLIKFGFTSNPYIDTYELRIDNELKFLLDIDKTKGHLNIHWKHIELKHIHQLQNLYFALTGEELKITKS